jgi:hypothetical protein
MSVYIKLYRYYISHESCIDNGCIYVGCIGEGDKDVWTYCLWWIGIDKIK